MYNYYNLDIIPIILNRFKVKNIVISGMGDKSIVDMILKYCDMNDASYIAIDPKDDFEEDFIQDYALNVLPTLNDYDAIFINDDPNWYTVYNELNFIKKNNDEFPLVFICNNVFPHKRRDSYINPDIIPDDFRNDFSKNFEYCDISFSDDFYHAIKENTPKNGVLTATEDFVAENQSISIMNIKLINGIMILYPENSISKIRMGRLSEEIQGHDLEFDELSDNIVENQFLSDYVSKLNISNEKIINDFENKLKLHDDELKYKDSQIEVVDSKLSLKDAQISNFESKLVNRENEIDTLNTKLQYANNQISLLKKELNDKSKTFENKEIEFNSKISSLKNNISQKEKIESELNSQLKIVNNKLQENINQINKKDNYILEKDNQILNKQNELNDTERMLESMKQQYVSQLSKLDNNKYCIGCYREEINNNHLEIQYLKKDTLTRKLLSPLAYVYLIFKSKPKELSINFKLYQAMRDSKCFDIGYYLANNKDIQESKWCKYFSPELHYVCNGFGEKRKFNKKYFNKNSKKELLDYIINCP